MDSNSVLPLDVSKQVPVIDFSDKTLKPGSSKWEQVRSDVRKALEDYGCFEACFDKVSTELKKSVFEAVEEIFNLPTETKQRNVSSKPFHGYDCRDLYQSLGIEDANFVEKVNEFAQQLWPDHGNNNISETFHKFSEQLMELDMMVRRMIMESFRIEKYIDEHLSSTNYVLRMMKYTPPLEDDETKIGLQSHTDKNFLTILHQHQVGGLEVKTKDDTWIKVKPSQYSCLVMVGDSLYALLNGRLFSPCHRVIMGNETRYSTGLFVTPNTDCIIDSPKELIDEEHPRKFKPFEFKDFLNFIYSEAAQKVESAIHAYCAI